MSSSEAHHHRGHQCLVVGRSGDVDGVGRLHELAGVERRVGGGRPAPGRMRNPVSDPDVVDQMPLSSRSSVATMPSSRLRASSVVRPGVAGQDLLGGQGLVAIDPGQKGAHVGPVQGGGVEERGQQGLGPLGPVRATRLPGAPWCGRAHLDQRPGHGQGARPGVARLQRRPSQRRRHRLLRSDGTARIEQVGTVRAPIVRHRGIEDIGFGRRRHHRSVGGQARWE